MDKLALKDYDIVFDNTLQGLNSFLIQHDYSRLFIIVDANSAKYCLPLVDAALDTKYQKHIIEVPSGEEHKNIASCEDIWQQLIIHHADRQALVINLGGGVIGDMGGFAASCYKRGIDFINIPTTLLSQVDASIGGKLGVDFKYGKNLIGLFRNPKMVLISTDFFKTLSDRQYVNGWAEIFKHALIKDAALWDLVKGLTDLRNVDIEDIVYLNLLIKKAVVEEDPFEKGLRKILNFGHTVGHAVEAWSLENDEEPLLHGEAIAIGMMVEAFLSMELSGFSKENFAAVCEALLIHFPKYDTQKIDHRKLWEIMVMDKKNAGDKVLAVLLKDIGNPVWDVAINPEQLTRALNFYQEL